MKCMEMHKLFIQYVNFTSVICIRLAKHNLLCVTEGLHQQISSATADTILIWDQKFSFKYFEDFFMLFELFLIYSLCMIKFLTENIAMLYMIH